MQFTRPSAPALKSEVEAGDAVALTTKEGKRHEFEVISVTDEIIAGREVSVRVEDIEHLQVTRLSKPKTALASLGVVGVALIALGTYVFIKGVEDGFSD